MAVGWRASAFAFAFEPAPDTITAWHGTLIEGREDASGQLFRRHRYVDPATGRFTQEDPLGVGGGLNLYGFAAGDPVNSEDPFGLWCEKRGPDSLHCENVGPGDFYTMSKFIGGEAGESAFHTFESAGWTQWSHRTCQGGFSNDQCSELAQNLANLTLSDDGRCSALGTGATKRFQQGRFRLHYGGIHGDNVGWTTPRILFWGGTTTLSSELFGTGRYAYGLQGILAHEQMHAYLFGEGLLNNAVLGEGPANAAGDRCGR